MKKFLTFKRDKSGATAIEFAMLILPFALAILVIIEVSLIFYVDTVIDSGVQVTARKVRVGIADDEGWDLAKFKEEACSRMALAFGCSDNLMVRATTLSDISTVDYGSPTTNGVLTFTEDFDIGGSGDYVLIQAILPWNPIVPLYTFSSATLSDGSYILSAATLFKNEPF